MCGILGYNGAISFFIIYPCVFPVGSSITEGKEDIAQFSDNRYHTTGDKYMKSNE